MGIADRKQRHNEQLRELILKASQHIVATEGYTALSMRRVAQEIEYSATTLYLYFENREAIVSELGRVGLVQLGDTLRASPPASTPLERLKNFAAAYLAFAEERSEAYRLIFMEDSRLAELIFRGKKTEAAADVGQQIFALLVEPFTSLKAEAPDWKEIDPLRCAEVFWTTLHGIVSLKITCGKFLQTPAAELAGLAIPALLAGLPRGPHNQ